MSGERSIFEGHRRAKSAPTDAGGSRLSRLTPARFRSGLVVVVTIGGATLAAGCATLLGADFDHAAEPVEAGASDDHVDARADATVTCERGRADCNRDPSDGCEIEIDSDPKHCGGCGRTCGAGLVCGKGACLTTCPEGTRSCSGACKAESATSCGAQCLPCSSPAYGAGICTPAGCDITCRAGYSRSGATCIDTMASDTWMQVANLPTARNALAAVTTGGLIYAVGGSTSTVLSTLEAYDPRTDSWIKLPDMPTARLGLAAAVGADGRIYAIGGSGFDFTTSRSTVEAYTPATKTWTPVADMPTARSMLAAVTGADGRIYAIGGVVGPLTSDMLSTVEVYTPSTNSWASVANLPTKRAFLGAAVGSDGRIYAVGGDSPGGLASVAVYTPSSNSWTGGVDPSTPRQALAVASVNNLFFAIGGLTVRNSDTYSPATESFTPGDTTWASRAPMPTGRSFLAAVGVEGRIYAIGGQRKSSDPRLATVEVYKP